MKTIDKESLITQVNLLACHINEQLECSQVSNIPQLIGAEIELLKTVYHYVDPDSILQDWPEGVSNDNPDELSPDDKEQQEKGKKRGFYA